MPAVALDGEVTFTVKFWVAPGAMDNDAGVRAAVQPLGGVAAVENTVAEQALLSLLRTEMV